MSFGGNFFNIAVFLFIVQTFATLFVTSSSDFGFITVVYSDSPSSEAMQALVETEAELTPSQQITANDPIGQALGWFYMQINNIASKIFSTAFPIIKYIAWVPFYLQAIGVPGPFAWGIFSIITMIEVLGFYEFLSGRPIGQ